MRDRVVVAVVVALLTALTYVVFPGHTYLQQDTQIYVPMLEKLVDPTLFAHDLLTSRPHMGWTLYDEITMLAHRLAGLNFEAALTLQQWVLRALGIWGVYLIGTSMNFTRRLSLFTAALFSLGATIVGPAVLTLEYEPVPRGFAVPLVLLAIGLLLKSHPWWAAAAGAVAMLYHAPTTAAFWLVFAVAAWRGRFSKALGVPAAAALVLMACSRWQPGVTERPRLFGTISAALEQLQRMRASYNWVSLWPWAVMWHYAILLGVVFLAMYRLRARLGPEHRIVLAGLAVAGALSIPISFVTLEVMKWSAMPQFQPARNVLFITALAIILSAFAGMQAAYEKRFQETFAWMLVPFIVPVHAVLPPSPGYTLSEAALILALAAAATGAVAVHVFSPRRAAAALAMVGLGAFFAIPMLGGVRNYPALWTSELMELSRWAKSTTHRDAVFHFDGNGKDLSPGLFRAEAQRAVYVEWKTGGQVNYFEDLALEWWERWQHTMLKRATDAELTARGVDYVVVRVGESRPGSHLYSNAKYVVYRIR